MEHVKEVALRFAEEKDREAVGKHLVSADASVIEAMAALNRLSGDTMTLFAVDGEGRLIGSLTDGDVRRALIGGDSTESRVAEICNRNCVTLDADTPAGNTVSIARERNITLLPVVRQGYIIRLIDLRKRKGHVPAAAVLMAGGAGERLRPLTNSRPKPLLEVGGKAIIEYNISLLRSYGIEDIFVTVNYLKEQIESYVKDLEIREGIRGIRCVAEPEKLGTMGSVTLIPHISAPNLIVMNSDLLTDIDLEAMYLKHLETEADITMAVVPYTVSVPFAIVGHEGDRVTGIVEKPTYTHYANAGIYMMRRDAALELPKRRYLDAPDVIEDFIRGGKRVSQFIIRGQWTDIGSPDDYRHACDLMASRNADISGRQ